jgi:tetratricopeptide (TPR) repeat protein
MFTENEPVFRRGDWAAFGVTFVIALAAYGATLAPTVTLEDCGELATASTFLGVPHPPGYPSWTLITWLFTKLFSGVSYLGHPNPAWAVAFASAFFGALTCGVLALLISGSGRLIADSQNSAPKKNPQSAIRNPQFLAGVTGGLLLAFSPVLWSQSTIVEVYALNVFLQVTILALLYRWLCRPAQSWALLWVCFLFGFGVTNHQTLLFLGPALAVAVLLRDMRLFRDFAIVGVGLALVIFVNIWLGQQAHTLARLADAAADGGQTALLASLRVEQTWYEQVQWIAGPLSAASPARNAVVAGIFHLTGANINPAFWIWTLLALTLPLAGLWLPNGRKVCAGFLLAGLGLAFYFLLPLFSAHNPPINWGYPCTWEGLLYVIRRGQYNAILLADIFSFRFVEQVAQFLGDLRGQFTLPAALLGLLPFCAWSVQGGGRRWRVLTVALGLGLVAFALVVLETISGARALAVGHHAVASVVFLLALMGCGLMLHRFVCEWLAELHADGTNILTRVTGLFLVVGALLLLLGVEVMLLTKAWQLLRLGAAVKAALVLLLVLAPPAAVWAFRRGTPEPYALRCDLPAIAQRWLLASVVAFLALSILFITFANQDVDIQTRFIGRVQFIQAHTLFALWLGYGLVLALPYGRRGWWVLGVAVAVLAPLTLVHQNYFDARRLRVVGGAEQNGHDFGWQFGVGALEGMAGLRATVPPGEPPPPNPHWPPPLATNAIFFGGTDPGRFVPTYMVFCARVRPDVVVLTQNALVDKLYLTPTRNLYGQRLWLPAPDEADAVLRGYISEVEHGRIRNRGEVSFDGGYASLMGRQGVMAVNSRLARAIFETNKTQHAFYIEESDPIEWMYPYLTPHGFIMKINPEPLAHLPPDIIREDRAFWDWQTRRLLDNWRYRHDAVAQKVFTKLRCAIGGIYASRKMYAEAEAAYRQAIQLYPLGPEAHFRLAGLFMEQDRLADARRVIAELLRKDEHLRGALYYRDYIENTQRAKERRTALEEARAAGTLALTNALELAEIYDRFSQETNFVATVQGLLTDASQPTNVPLAVAQFLVARQRFDLLPQAFERHLAQAPRDVTIWVEFAAFRLYQNQTNAALDLLRKAIQLDASRAGQQIRGDCRFHGLQKLPELRQIMPPPVTFKLDSLRAR